MKKFLSGAIVFLTIFSAYAQTQAPEPPVESNTVGTIVFGVLFVGFCLGFMWMVWKNRDKEKKE